MENRWKSHDASEAKLEFIGAMDRFDIWAREERADPNMPFYVRIVWGDDTREWDSAWNAYHYEHPREGKQVYLHLHHREEGGPSEAENLYLTRYLMLFVPEFSDTLTKEPMEN